MGRVRSLWAAGLLLRRLRSEAGVVALIFLLVAATSFVFSAAPRLLNRVSDDALQYAAQQATPVQRGITASQLSNIGGGEGDGVKGIHDYADRLQRQLPASFLALVAERRAYATSIRFEVIDPPSYDTRMILRYQDGFPEQARIVDGRWPEDTGGRLQIRSLFTDAEQPAEPGEPIEPDPNAPHPEAPAERFEIAVSAAAAAETGIQLGDRLAISFDGSDRNIDAREFELARTELEVVGLFEPLDEAAAYWLPDPTLLHASQRGSEDNPVAWVTAYVSPEEYPGLAGSRLSFHYDWRFLTDPARFDSSIVPQLQADLRRLGVTGAGSATSGNVTIQTGLPRILDRFVTQQAQTETVLSIAAIGPFGLAAGAMAMVALLLVRRRREAVALARGRGASGALVLGTQLWEALLIAGGAALLGLVLAMAVVPARTSPLSAVLAIAVGILATLLLVGSSWAVARRPLGNVERDETPIRQLSPRRLVIEATIVLLAVAATLLLRQRGLAPTPGATGAAAAAARFDPFLASVPVLAGLAAGIVALRLYPLPIRALGWLAARRRDFIPVLGLRTIGRHPGAANLPLLVLLLTAAFGAFSSVLSTSIDRGQLTASYLDVGADFRIERVGFGSMPEPEDVTATEGIEAMARAVIDDSASFASTPGQRTSIYLEALETTAYDAVTAGLPVAPAWPEAFRAAPGADPGSEANPIPVILSNRTPTGSVHIDPGETFQARLGDRTLVFAAVERRDTFPGIDTTIFAVAPYEWVQAAFPRPLGTSAMFVRGSRESGEHLDSTLERVGAGSHVISRYAAYDALHDAPLEAVISAGYVVALVVAATYMALSIIGAMVLSAAGRTRDLAYLRTLGVTGRQSLLLTVMEHGPPVVLALAPGVLLGIGIAMLVEPGLGLGTFVGTSGVPLYVDWLALATMAGALIAVVALAVGTGTWLARRARPTDALRMGEH